MLKPSSHFRLHLHLKCLRMLIDGNVRFLEGLFLDHILTIRTLNNTFKFFKCFSLSGSATEYEFFFHLRFEKADFVV